MCRLRSAGVPASKFRQTESSIAASRHGNYSWPVVITRMKSIWNLVVCGLLMTPSAKAAMVDYGRDILPILSDKCYHCHGPDEKGRKGKLRLDTREGAFRTKDPVIIPSRSGESELVKRITTKNPDDQMPPPDSNRSLTPKQIELLTRWVEEGAKWGQHWAFVSPQKPEVPSKFRVPSSEFIVTNPIDAFVLARLEKEGLTPAPVSGEGNLAATGDAGPDRLAPDSARVGCFPCRRFHQCSRASGGPVARLAALW